MPSNPFLKAAPASPHAALAARLPVTSADRWRFDNQQAAHWLDTQAAAGSEFAKSLSASLARFGSLTERQHMAVERCIERDRMNAAPAAADTSRISAAFAAASTSGLKKPRLRLGAFEFSLMGARSRYAGQVCVRAAGQLGMSGYRGRFDGGHFMAGMNCTTEDRTAICELAGDPGAHAEKYGRLTGACAVCARPLSNPESVARGIGPTCAARFKF